MAARTGERRDAQEAGALRLDKWLWQARFYKRRSLAAEAIAAFGVRINGEKTDKPAQQVRPGDVLTFVRGQRVIHIEIRHLGRRRGPAAEAGTLYADLSVTQVARAAKTGLLRVE